jgi:hypothetical protein
MEKEILQPGERGLAQLRLMKPVAALPREPFVICPLNVNMVMGGGTVLEIPREKFRVVKAQRTLPYLSALKSCDLLNCVQHFFEAHTDLLLVPAELAHTSGFSIDEVTGLLKEKERSGEVLTFRDKGYISRKRYDQLKKELPGILQNVLARDPLKRNVKAEEIRRQLSPHLEEEPFQRMLSDLCRRQTGQDHGLSSQRCFRQSPDRLLGLFARATPRYGLRFTPIQSEAMANTEAGHPMLVPAGEGKLVVEGRRYILLTVWKLEKVKGRRLKGVFTRRSPTHLIWEGLGIVLNIWALGFTSR